MSEAQRLARECLDAMPMGFGSGMQRWDAKEALSDIVDGTRAPECGSAIGRVRAWVESECGRIEMDCVWQAIHGGDHMFTASCIAGDGRADLIERFGATALECALRAMHALLTMEAEV